jgi:hypothetical protein
MPDLHRAAALLPAFLLADHGVPLLHEPLLLTLRGADTAAVAADVIAGLPTLALPAPARGIYIHKAFEYGRRFRIGETRTVPPADHHRLEDSATEQPYTNRLVRQLVLSHVY